MIFEWFERRWGGDGACYVAPERVVFSAPFVSRRALYFAAYQASKSSYVPG